MVDWQKVRKAKQEGYEKAREQYIGRCAGCDDIKCDGCTVPRVIEALNLIVKANGDEARVSTEVVLLAREKVLASERGKHLVGDDEKIRQAIMAYTVYLADEICGVG